MGLERDCQKEERLPRGLGWEMAQRPSLQLSWKTAPRVRVWTERKGYTCSWPGAGKGLPRDLGWETPSLGNGWGGLSLWPSRQMRVQVEKQKAWCYCWSEAGKVLSKVSDGCQESWAERKLSCEQRVRWSSLQFFTKRGLSERESLQLNPGLGASTVKQGLPRELGWVKVFI